MAPSATSGPAGAAATAPVIGKENLGHADAIELKVPRVRDGSYFPSLLEPRPRAEEALSAVVQEAYVHAILMRKINEL